MEILEDSRRRNFLEKNPERIARLFRVGEGGSLGTFAFAPMPPAMESDPGGHALPAPGMTLCAPRRHGHIEPFGLMYRNATWAVSNEVTEASR